MTPTENWRLKSVPAESLHLQQIKFLRRVGWRGVGEDEIARAVKLIGRNGRPVGQRQQKIGRGQHVIDAVAPTATATQYKTAATRGNDVPETRRRRNHRQDRIGTGRRSPVVRDDQQVISAVVHLRVGDGQDEIG